MSKGLKILLDKIAEDPRQTLVGRFLSLIADIQDEDSRASFALDLAERIVKTKTNDALKIAYMVFASGRYQIRALKTVISCFEEKGRPGKVAVLKIELEKLQGAGGEERGKTTLPLPPMNFAAELGQGQFSIGEVSEVAKLPIPSHQVAGSGEQENTRMAELDLGDFEDDFGADGPMDLLFPDKIPNRPAQPNEIAPPELNLVDGFFGGFSGRPGDTVLPMAPVRFGQDDDRSEGTQASQVVSSRTISPEYPGKTVNLNEMPRVTLDRLSKESPLVPLESLDLVAMEPNREGIVPPAWVDPERIKKQPASGRPANSAPSAVFDRLFSVERFSEAESVLVQARSESGFEWWQDRFKRLHAVSSPGYRSKLKENIQPTKGDLAEDFFRAEPVLSLDELRPHNVGENKGERESDATPAKSVMDIRCGIITEVFSLAEKLGVQNLRQTKASSEVTFSSELKNKLRAIEIGTKVNVEIFFDLLQGLSAGEPGGDILELIEHHKLERRSPHWFGFYLDGLIFSGFGRKALIESVRALEENLSLTWAKVVWGRLPKIWQIMYVDGFVWTEDDGVRALLDLLKKRPQQNFSSYETSWPTHSEANIARGLSRQN